MKENLSYLLLRSCVIRSVILTQSKKSPRYYFRQQSKSQPKKQNAVPASSKYFEHISIYTTVPFSLRYNLNFYITQPGNRVPISMNSASPVTSPRSKLHNQTQIIYLNFSVGLLGLGHQVLIYGLIQHSLLNKIQIGPSSSVQVNVLGNAKFITNKYWTFKTFDTNKIYFLQRVQFIKTMVSSIL